MDSFAALIPDSGPAAPQKVTKAPPPPSKPAGNVGSGTKVLELVANYATPAVMLKLAQVSRYLRSLATRTEYWEPYLDKMGVTRSSSSQKPLYDDITALTVLDAGYCRSAYDTIQRILRLLGGYYIHPENIKRDFPQLADQAHVLLNVQRLSCLDDDSPATQQARLFELQAAVDAVKEHAALQFGEKLEHKMYAEAKPFAELLIVFNDEDTLVEFYLSRTILPPAPSPLLDVDNQPIAQLKAEAAHVVDFLNPKAKEIDQLFGPETPVFKLLLEKTIRSVMDLVSKLCEQEKAKSMEQYFALVPQAYEVLDKEIDRLEPCANAGDAKQMARELLQDTMTEDIGAFLDQQSDEFKKLANEKVAKWAQEITEKEHEFERVTLANVPGSQEKSNFLRSFKKVLMFGGDSEHRVEDGSLTEFEAQAKVMESKLQGIETLFSLELTLSIIAVARSAIRRARPFAKLPGPLGQKAKAQAEALFVDLVAIIGDKHIQLGFESALNTLNQYDPKKYGRLVDTTKDKEAGMTVEPLAIFAELVNIGDLIQQTIHVFFEQELAAPGLVDRNDFVASSVNTKRRFEQMLDTWVADGLSRGIDVLIEQIEFVLVTVQLASDFDPLPGSPPEVGPTEAAIQVISLVKSHVVLLVGSAEKSLLDVFRQEVGLRLYHSLCKHIKRQTISQEGAVRLISDMNYYYDYISTLRQRQLYPYYEALKQLSQLFLVGSADGRQLGVAISDFSRFNSVLGSDELVEFMKRRKDWAIVKPKVEKVLYGFGECVIC